MENGREVMQKEIIVNDPLRYKGINIFQSSFGEMPNKGTDNTTAIEKTDRIELSFRSAASGMIYSQTTTLGQAVEIPEGLGRLVVDQYTSQGKFQNMELGPTLVATLTPREGPPQTLQLPLKFPKFDSMRRGEVVITAIVAAAKQRGPIYYTGLQVTKDPGVMLVYIGFVLMIAGCGITFFLFHQEVVIAVRPQGGGIEVLVSGTANKNKLGMQTKMERLTQQLEKSCLAVTAKR
jgi:cytochrome c biogenesis protein